MFKLTNKPIDSAEVLAGLCDDRAGAAVAFEGWVRNHNQGLKVNSLEYQVYEELAISEGKKILTEASEKFNILKITCVHRYGHLMIGDLSVYIASVSAHRDDSFKAARYVIDEIKKRLPIWKKEHYHDHKPKWVFCRDHQHHVHFEPKDYYLKQDKLVSNKQLGDKRVVVVGAGGLGCPVITGLAGAGVGVIDIVDHDRIDISNVHRQFLYSPNLVGESKAEVAKSKASDINPFIKVRSITDYLSIENAESLFIQADLVVDCTDNLSSKYLIHDVCFKLRIPFISASIHKFNAILRTFDPVAESGCLRCDSDIDSHEFSGNCNDYGVLGASVSAIGFLQACEAINFLASGKNESMRNTILFDIESVSQLKIKNNKKADCIYCRGEHTVKQDDFEIVKNDLADVEYDLIDIRSLSIDEIQMEVSQHDRARKLVLYCNKGQKSRKIVSDLRQVGHQNCYSLKGGACSL